MGNFIFGTPQGFDVEVRANSQEEALEKLQSQDINNFPKIIKRIGNKGRVLEQAGKQFFVGEGVSTADPKKIEKLMRKATTEEEISQQIRDRGVLDKNIGKARYTQFAEGMPFVGSYIDEMAGDQAGENWRKVSQAMQRERPGESFGLNVAGGLTSGGLTAAAAPTKAAQLGKYLTGGNRTSTLAKVKQAALGTAGLAGLEGGIYGYGEGETPEERAETAAKGAAFGATTGAVMGPLMGLASKGIENVGTFFRKTAPDAIAKHLGISTNAAKVIQATFEAGDGIENAIQNVRKAGDTGMVADADIAQQMLLDAAATASPQARRITSQEIGQRATDVRQNLESKLTETLGDAPIGPRAAAEQIAERTRPQRQAAYQKAYGQRIDYDTPEGQALNEVISRVPAKDLAAAIERANEKILMRSDELLEQGIQPRQFKAKMDPETGDMVFEEQPSMMQLDFLKRSLGDIAEGAKTPLGRSTGESIDYERITGQLRGRMGEISPDYDKAVRLGGENIADQKAFTMGSKALNTKTKVEDVMDILGDNPTATQLEAAKMGLRQNIRQSLDEVKEVPSDPEGHARQIAEFMKMSSSPAARQKIRLIMGDEAESLLNQLDEVKAAVELRFATSINSKTAARQQAIGSVEEITDQGVFGKFARGEPIDASKEVMQILTGQTKDVTEAKRLEIFDEIAKALTQKRGKDAEAALRYIQKASRGERLSQAQAKFVNDIANGVTNIGLTTGVARGRKREED